MVGDVQPVGHFHTLESMLGEPCPRRVPSAAEEFAYSTGERLRLPAVQHVPVDLWTTLSHRRSHREFATLDLVALSALLWYTNRIIEQSPEVSALGRRAWEHRVTPSAGGRHPIDVWVCSPSGGWPSTRLARVSGHHRSIWLYDAQSHALLELVYKDYDAALALEALPAQALEGGRGLDLATVMWHVAQVGRTKAAYENPESLIWRDAGCLVAMTALVATGLGLACCPLGPTGEPFVSRVIGASPSQLRGVGGCIVGRLS